MLLDPFEKEFYLPSGFVRLSDGQGRKEKIVCEKNETVAVFEIEEADAPQRIWIFLGCFESLKDNGLVAPESGGFVDLSVSSSNVIEIAFGANDEKR